ncbi:hypothetical protein PNOK_0182900 [Pyrrhoderma noxium]|uniref:Uncharacterized protein n=1 Tax=Pyrrhoderma noxium TaxID=2282107 RepID=A0A286UQM7_9AGAM|nr:hypothetical protein PNOK_0182900 [Pyrrhoderma noxium]
MLVENQDIEYTSLSQFSRASFTSSISSPDDEAALNTIQFVQSLMTSSSRAKIKFDLSSYTLLLSTKDIVSSYPQNGIREGIENAKLLSQAARRCAPAYACSSILAGHTSEGDEYSDIGIWISAEDLNIGIGANGSSEEDESCVTTNLEENSRKVLSALGLDLLLSSSSINIKPLRLSPNIHIPTTFELPTDVTSSYSPTHLSLASSSSLTTAITTTTTVSTPSSSSNPLTDLISLLSNLHGDINSNSVPIAFIVNATELDGLSLYFLLGRPVGPQDPVSFSLYFQLTALLLQCSALLRRDGIRLWKLLISDLARGKNADWIS